MRLLTSQTEFVPLDYKSFVAHIREVGVHEPRADHHDRHLGLPVTAKFYRMPDGTVYGIKEWHGEEVIVPAPADKFNHHFPQPPQGNNVKEAQNGL